MIFTPFIFWILLSFQKNPKIENKNSSFSLEFLENNFKKYSFFELCTICRKNDFTQSAFIAFLYLSGRRSFDKSFFDTFFDKICLPALVQLYTLFVILAFYYFIHIEIIF